MTEVDISKDAAPFTPVNDGGYTDIDPDYLHKHPEQDKSRLGNATASEFAAVLARRRDGHEASARRNYRIQLALERVIGRTPSRFISNAYTDWGHDTEELAAVEFMLRHPELDVQTCGFIKHSFLAAGASPDRLIDNDGVLEIKCFNSANHYEALRTGQLPAEYRPQVQGQLWITERRYSKAVMFDPDFPPDAQLVILHVERDERYIDNLMVDVANFLEEVDEQEKFIRDYRPVA